MNQNEKLRDFVEEKAKMIFEEIRPIIEKNINLISYHDQNKSIQLQDTVMCVISAQILLLAILDHPTKMQDKFIELTYELVKNSLDDWKIKNERKGNE